MQNAYLSSIIGLHSVSYAKHLRFKGNCSESDLVILSVLCELLFIDSGVEVVTVDNKMI